jgi:hypothetical protein
MNNQFSQRVSDIITYSKEEANRLRNRYIGPEHLLLGMLRDGGGKAIEILLKLDIDLKRVKSRLEGFLKDAEDDTLLPDILKRKVVKGGSWKDIAYYLQCGVRTYEYQTESRPYIGFRCVRSYNGE